jgi:hypothetical protein
MQQSCGEEVWLIGRHLRAIHEVGLRAMALRSWPDPMTRAHEMRKVAVTFHALRNVLMSTVSDMLQPIELELDELAKMEACEMIPQKSKVGHAGFVAGLPRAFAITKAGAQGADTTEAELLEALETFNTIADHAITEVASPHRVGEVIGPMGGVHGHVSGEVGPAGYSVRSGVSAVPNPTDDEAMAAYVVQMAQAGAFASADPSGTGTKAGAPLAPSQVPFEDRGRTDPTVQSGANVLDSLGDMPPIPGVSPAIMQWLPTAIWAIKKAGELISAIKAKRAA